MSTMRRERPGGNVRSDEAREYHRLYQNKRWRNLRAAQLRREPLCKFCRERDVLTPATVADHVEPHRGDLTKFYDPNNLQSLCPRCHSGVKLNVERRGYSTEVDPATGFPLDPRHPFNR